MDFAIMVEQILFMFVAGLIELAPLTYEHQTHAQRRGCIHFPSVAK